MAIVQADSEQFKMLSMIVQDTTRGMCIFQADTAKEQQLIAYELKDSLAAIPGKNTLVIDMADFSQNTNDVPMDIQQIKCILEKKPDCTVVVVCNLQLCGLWFGDITYIEKLNYMRDQLMECNKMWVFGMTPYFSILLSQNARDLYTYMMYSCSFKSEEDKKGFSNFDNREYSGDIRLRINQFEEYRRYIDERKEGEIDWQMVFRTIEVWLHCADYMDYTSAEWVKKILIMMEEHLSSFQTTVQEFYLYHLISDAYIYLDDYNKALQWAKGGLQLIQNSFPADSEEMAEAFVNMASCYLNAEKWNDAEKYCQKALKIFEKKGKKYDIKLITLWTYIAKIYTEKRNFDEAIIIYDKNIEIILEKSNESNFDLLIAYNNLGRVYQEKGQVSKALQYFKKSKELGDKYHSGNVLTQVFNLNNIANVYHRMGDLENAKKCLLEAKKDCKHFIGEKNAATSHIYHNLAALYSDLGQYSLAEKNYLKAMEIRKTVLGERNSSLASTYFELAILYAMKGTRNDLIKAYTYAKKSLDIRIEIYGMWHDETAESYDTLARICYFTAQFEMAREYIQSAHKIYIKLYGKNSKKVTDNEYNMKLLQQASGKK